MSEVSTPARTGGNLSTFAGVFTPSILTIPGLMLFLRSGFVVGSAGLTAAVVIILVANVCLGAHQRLPVGHRHQPAGVGGGDYYLISRTLGMEFVGGFIQWAPALIDDNLEPANGLAFWPLFAIFFPAATGVTQGVSMSGDLTDPGHSLSLGTFLAVGTSLVVYLAAAVVIVGAIPGQELVDNPQAMRRIAPYTWLVDAGVIAACLSSGLASFLDAPRILQALSADGIIQVLSPFAKGHGESDNPRRGVLLTLVIAAAVIGLGSLNLVAVVVTMFFLISYGLLNYATYAEARGNSPYFRPRFT